jgi:hypothetical protein
VDGRINDGLLWFPPGDYDAPLWPYDLPSKRGSGYARSPVLPAPNKTMSLKGTLTNVGSTKARREGGGGKAARQRRRHAAAAEPPAGAGVAACSR